MDVGTITSFFSSVPADWIIIATAALLFLVDAFRVGPGRVAAVAIAMHIAVLAWNGLQSAAFLSAITKQFSTPVLQALLFGILLIIIYFLLRRIFTDYGDTGGQPIQAVFAAAAAAALVFVAWIQVSALASVWDFGDDVRAVFGEAYRFWWLLGSLAALAFAKS